MADTKNAADYRDYLHRYGLKNTRHRQLILQLLLASEGVLTAEESFFEKFSCYFCLRHSGQ